MAKSAKKNESDSATETQETENADKVFARISKASFMWSKFDPRIQGVPPITREGVKFDASHRNSVEREAEKSGVKLTFENR